MNLELVISIVTSLGIFEALKLILNHWLKETVIAKNLEIRKISDNALKSVVWLKERNFETGLPRDVESLLVLDVHKIDGYQKNLGDKLMQIINYPRMIEILYKNGGEKNRDLITKLHKDVTKTSDYLTKELSRLRYKPLFERKHKK